MALYDVKKMSYLNSSPASEFANVGSLFQHVRNNMLV